MNVANVAKNIADFNAFGKLMTKRMMLHSEHFGDEKALAKIDEQIKDEADKLGIKNLDLRGVPGSGLDANGDITIAGKLMGRDENFTGLQIENLRDFMEQNSLGLPGMLVDADSFRLLDRADISIDEFKELWSKNVKKIEDSFKNNQPAKNENKNEVSESKFKPIQTISKTKTYKDEAMKEYQQFYKFIEREFNSGKNVFEILKKVAESRVDKLA